jgi:hypothetical protein
MCISNLCNPYIELATDVFKSQNPMLLKSLRDFLTGLPHPNCEENIITAAFHQLALTDIEACRWLLRNSYALLPEVDFVTQAIDLATTLLHAQGFLSGKDFSFESSRQLVLTDKAKASLWAKSSVGDRLLLEEVLHISVKY